MAKQNPKRKMLTRVDPTRTVTYRRAFIKRLRKKFARLKGRIVAGIAREDWLGLKQNGYALNCQPGQLRGADGKCGPGVGADVPREQMPQVHGDDVPDLIGWLLARGVTVRREVAPASSLRPTQSRFRQERVDAIPSSALSQPVLTSADNYVLDGTHRWVKHWQERADKDVPILRIDLPLPGALAELRQYPRAKYKENSVGNWTAAGKALRQDGGAMPGYGQIWFNEDTSEAWYVGGDGDERGFDKRVREVLLELPNVKSVRYESEVRPKEPGWKLVYNEQRLWPTTNAELDAFNAETDRRMRAAVWGPTLNEFCPTGEGGGVDPTCSPHSGGGKSFSEMNLKIKVPYGTKEQRQTGELVVYKNASKDQLKNLLKNVDPDEIAIKGMVDIDGNSYAWEVPLGSEGMNHGALSDHLGITAPFSSRYYVERGNNGQPLVQTHSGVGSSPLVKRWADAEGLAINVNYLSRVDMLLNSFFAECERDEHGRCIPRGGSASEAARGLVAKVRQKVLDKFAKMQQRYGRAGAIAVMAGIAATLPAPIPGSSFVVIGVAEGIRAAVKIGRHLARNERFDHALLDQLTDAAWRIVDESFADEDVPHGMVRSKLRDAIAREMERAPTGNTRWAFHSDAAKLDSFRQWLLQQLEDDLDSAAERHLWELYVKQGFEKGAGRAWDDFQRRRNEEAGTPDASIPDVLKFDKLTKDAFVGTSAVAPETVEKVQLLVRRTFEELDGISADSARRMTRVLADGLVEGKHPREVARDLADELDITRSRAETIAQTEFIRAHAEGQLDALERLGVQEVGVEVEFATADDDDVCEDCDDLQGVVLSIDDAHGVIPVHPRCRCAFIPANVGEDQEDQKRGAAADRAMASVFGED